MLGNNLRQKSNIIFFYLIGISLLFLSLILYLAVNFYSNLGAWSRSAWSKLESICGCANHLSFTSHPFIFTFTIIIGTGLVLFFIFALFKIITLRRNTNKFVKQHLANRKLFQSAKLKKAAQFLGMSNTVIEIEDHQPVVFCFGFRTPKICISSGLIEKLSNQELKAVLLHEQYHLKSYEPIKLFLVKIMAKIWIFVPGIRSLSLQYLTYSELAADEFATDGFKNKIFLARALAKIMRWQERAMIKNNLALSFFGAITTTRINKLVDDKYKPLFKFYPITIILTVIIMLLAVFVGQSFNSNHLLAAEHGVDACPLSTPVVKHQCEAPVHEPTDCQTNYIFSDAACL